MAFRQVRRILLTALLGGLLGATLVRLGPGFGVDERELDNRLSQESRQAIRAEHAHDNNIAMFYLRYLAGLAAWRSGILEIAQPAGIGVVEGTPAVDAGIARPTAYWAAFPSDLRSRC